MKTVMVFGTFDILHLGHIYLFKKAKKYGKCLIVVVARDNNVRKVKGKLPLHTEKERLEILKNIKIIDKAILGDKKNFYKVIQKFKPDAIVLGYDQKVSGGMKKNIRNAESKIKIIRIKPYLPSKYKSKKIKKILENTQ